MTGCTAELAPNSRVKLQGRRSCPELPHREEESALAKTAGWITDTSSAVGGGLTTRRSSGDEQQPLLSRLSIDEEMGLVSQGRLPHRYTVRVFR